MSLNNTPINDSAPSMLYGHVEYIQGAVLDAAGYESGKATKEEAVEEMRQAKKESSSAPPKTSNLLGEAESVLGKITGCEGMKEEGEARKPAAADVTKGEESDRLV